MFPGSNTGVTHSRDLRWQPRPLTSAWPWVVIQTMDINIDPSCNRTKEPDTALSGSLGQDVTMASGGSHSDQCCPPSHALQPWTSTWSQAAAQTTDIQTATKATDISTDCGYRRGVDTDMAAAWLDLSMASLLISACSSPPSILSSTFP